MPLVTNEQDEKRPSQFIKLEDKSKLKLYSHLFKTPTHFLQGKNTSVLCKGEDCYYCNNGVKSRMEYFYYGDVDGQEGIIRIPASVFYALNEQERVLEINKQDSIWVISKKGSGLETEYSVARGREAGTPPISIDKASKKLTEVLDNYVKNLEQKYKEMSVKDIFETPVDYTDEDAEQS